MRYHRPQSRAEASAILLERHGNVAVLNGGTFLLPRMTRHLMEFEHVVDIQDLGVRQIERVDDRIQLGAGTTYVDVLDSELLCSNLSLLPKMARGVTGGRQITQQGTLIGALCFHFPTTDAPAALFALQGDVDIHGPEGPRSEPISDFLIDAFVVDLRPGEFVTGMRFAPQPSGGYCKVKHSTGSWPIVTASAVPGPEGGVEITLGAVEALPIRVVVDEPLHTTRMKQLVENSISEPWSDVHAPGSYRADIAAAVARRAVDELLGARV
jgi:carbon-monoxide dehydrogenase medium subunit